MKSTTLVIMAAGIGSRFGGGIKQLEPVGPNGEIIMDYSIHDARQAGFEKIVFIIRKDIEKDFKEIIGNRIAEIAPVTYAFQALEDLPEGHQKPEGRTKPWGTGQAVLSVKGIVNEPFLVINADDYYGKEGFKKIHDYLVREIPKPEFSQDTGYDICMAGFILSNTLSENGGVTRGVCELDEEGFLRNVTETYEIQLVEGKMRASDELGNPVTLSANQHVSMNMWGFTPDFLDELETGFPVFLDSLENGDLKSEYLLPKIIDRLLETGRAKVRVLETADRWFGVTYKEDKQNVTKAIHKLIADGVYGSSLEIG